MYLFIFLQFHVISIWIRENKTGKIQNKDRKWSYYGWINKVVGSSYDGAKQLAVAMVVLLYHVRFMRDGLLPISPHPGPYMIIPRVQYICITRIVWSRLEIETTCVCTLYGYVCLYIYIHTYTCMCVCLIFLNARSILHPYIPSYDPIVYVELIECTGMFNKFNHFNANNGVVTGNVQMKNLSWIKEYCVCLGIYICYAHFKELCNVKNMSHFFLKIHSMYQFLECLQHIKLYIHVSEYMNYQFLITTIHNNYGK